MNKISVSGIAIAALALTMAVTSTVSAQETGDADSQEKTEPTVRLATANAGSSIQLKTTSVTGSRELPKVLVIVPWKSSEAMGPGERPLASLVEEALTPVDPDVFRRQLSYYTKLKDASAKTSSSKKAN